MQSGQEPLGYPEWRAVEQAPYPMLLPAATSLSWGISASVSKGQEGKELPWGRQLKPRWFSRRKLLSQHTFDLFSAGSWPSAAEEVAKYLAGIASSSAFSQLHCHTKFSIKWKMENYNPALQVSDLLIQHQLLTYMPAHPPKNKTIHPPTLK